MRNRIVLAEGIQDVYFWTGLAKRFGWEEDRKVSPVGGKLKQHGLRKDGIDLRVVECKGKDAKSAEQGVISVAGFQVKAAMGDPIAPVHLLINLDGDAAVSPAAMDDKLAGFASGAGLAATGAARRQWVPRAATGPDQSPPHVDLLVEAVIWSGPEVNGLDAAPCLERLVAGALATVGPSAWAQVHQFMAARGELGPSRPSPAHKAAIGAIRAGWFADHSDGSFLEHLWAVEPFAKALQVALEADGEWATIERFLRLDPSSAQGVSS